MYMRTIGMLLVSCIAHCIGAHGAVQLYERPLRINEHKKLVVIWEKKHTPSFDTMLISWESSRPKHGAYHIQVRMHGDGRWSDWIDYAWWGVQEQHMFHLQLYREMASFLQGKMADGFSIRLYAKEGADLSAFRGLWVSIMASKDHTVEIAQQKHTTVVLPVPGISQIAINDERNVRICSPTSTAAVIRYARKSDALDPLVFAEMVRDVQLNIYGVWALNTAQAAHELGARWHAYVTHLSGVDQLVACLKKGYPVVVSVQGPLMGSARPYRDGHLLVVKGYDAEARRILCMDPGFPDDQSTDTSYGEEDFVSAWRRRNGLAYIICT